MRQGLNLIIKFVFLASLFLIFYSYAMFQGAFVSWFLFYSALPILIYELAFILYPINDWKVKRLSIHKPFKAGETAQIEIEFERKLPFPIPYLFVEETLPHSLDAHFNPSDWSGLLAGKKIPKRERIVKSVFYPLFKRYMTGEYVLKNLPRGVHNSGEIKLTMTDLFGFVKKTVTLPAEASIRVVPADINIQFKFDDHKSEVGEDISSTIPVDRSSHISGARQYVPGDRFSQIHWKQTARQDALMTKEFDLEHSLDGMIVLLGINSGIAYEWNLAVSQAILKTFQQKRQRVDFFHIGTEHFSYSSERSIVNLIDAFTTFEAGAKDKMISANFERNLRKIDKGGFLFIFTDQITESVSQEILKARSLNYQITVYLTKASSNIKEDEQTLINRLKSGQVYVRLITEEELRKMQGVVEI